MSRTWYLLQPIGRDGNRKCLIGDIPAENFRRPFLIQSFLYLAVTETSVYIVADMIEIWGYCSVKHGKICSWFSVSGIFQFTFVCFWLTPYPSYSIHTLWMLPYTHCSIFWLLGMELHIASTVFLCNLARLEKLPAWNASLFPPSVEEDLSSHQLVEWFRATTMGAELVDQKNFDCSIVLSSTLVGCAKNFTKINPYQAGQAITYV